jgi:putative transposase
LRSRWRFGSQGIKKISYRGYHFPPKIIQQAIWPYLRFTLSLRDVDWHLDEVNLKIAGRMVYLWRAVDAEGEVLDVLVQTRRNKGRRSN